MFSIRKSELTEDDIAKIKSRRKFPIRLIIVFTIVFDILLLLLVSDEIIKILIIIASFDLLMCAPLIIIYKRWQKDINAGFKYAISGRVLRKSKLSNSSTRRLYITIDREVFEVTEDEYNSINENDEIEAEYTAFTKFSLFVKHKF